MSRLTSIQVAVALALACGGTALVPVTAGAQDGGYDARGYDARGYDARGYEQPAYVRIARNRSKVVRIPRPADTVVVGNPNIADFVLQDATTLVLTGKALGETNLIILDEDGDPIVDETIVVGEPLNAAVNIFRPAGRSAYRCSPDCSEVGG